jgi:hypothetical protein
MKVRPPAYWTQYGITGLNDRDFKNAVEEVGERHPFLVKLMIASWEFPQFIEMCREYTQENEDCYEEKSEGKVRSSLSVSLIFITLCFFFLGKQ